MKKYNVTVNGVTYEVLVEESDSAAPAAAPTAPAAPAAPAPKAAAPAPKAAAPSGAQGAIKVTAPMPGTILKMSLKVGDTIKANDLVCILEAMKMENEITAPVDGKIASLFCEAGKTVAGGEELFEIV